VLEDSLSQRIPRFGDGFVEDSGYEVSLGFIAPLKDRRSLLEARAEGRGRARRGIADLKARLARLPAEAPDHGQVALMIGLLHMYQGEFEEAIRQFNSIERMPDIPRPLLANIIALRGVASMRIGEVANCVACVGPSSCLFPIAPEAVHQNPDGSRAAIRDFTAYLQQRPDDVGVRWLLNLAYMTLGEYPAKVPAAYLIPLAPFRSTSQAGRFTNVALPVGLNARGQNMVGGSIFDDFNGDGLPDVFVCSIDVDLGASLFINRGDGTFEDRSAPLGLAEETLAINARQADFDNDGRLDVLLLRGGWEYPLRMSLLRNTGAGFEDITVASGLSDPIATESAEWGDYDNDGLLDLYVAGETRPNGFESFNGCRLYHNEGGGRFVNVAAKAGVENERWTKGTAWGDYDNDGLIDLYVSNTGAENRLYHNNGNGTFTDVAQKLGVTGPHNGFSCWFWDYDNDGRQDLFIAGFRATLNEYVSDVLKKPSTGERSRLYRNLGRDGFRDVTKEVGLDQVFMVMGSNFADIDNDGFLDIYLGTGTTTYSSLVPNVMLKNVAGTRFDDVTLATGTGHLQKGHGVSFADWNGDGSLDLFVETGGSVPGDRAFNSLFENPGHGHHWLSLKLNGVKTNRAAIGARVRVDFHDSKGRQRSVHRTVGGGSSFGGNSLTVHVGLEGATRADAVAISWPVGTTTQTFASVDADQSLEVTEGTANYRRTPRTRLHAPRTAGMMQ
jgi:hypothetical protein